MPDANVVIFGRCEEVLNDLDPKSVGAVITDPPYGIRIESHGMRFRGTRSIKNDDSIDLSRFIFRWCRDNRVPLVMFYSPFVARPGKFRSVLVWNKGEHTGIGGDKKTCWKRDFELIGVAFNGPLNGRRNSAVIKVNGLSPPPSGHVAEKPVAIMAYLIRKVTQEGQLVVDPCCGSGSTLVAAKQTGRSYFGVDADEQWANYARNRVKKSKGHAGLF